MNDDEIIRKRLLIDGDGTGDDRRINLLLKQFLRWMVSKTETPEDNEMIYNHLMSQLALCKFSVIKGERSSQMLNEELVNYKNIAANLEKNIEVARQEIKECKRKLATTKQMHLNNLEYGQLAKAIKQQPDRKKTQKQIEILQKELAVYNEKKLKLERIFKKRQKDSAVLMFALKELEAQLDTDSSGEEEGTTKNVAADDDNKKLVVQSKKPLPLKNSKKPKGSNVDDADLKGGSTATEKIRDVKARKNNKIKADGDVKTIKKAAMTEKEKDAVLELSSKQD